MAVPGGDGPTGRETALGDRFIEEPVLGVVMSYEPSWLSNLLEVAVVAIAPVVLAWAAETAMLGLSRHVYVLATNRQVPSWLGKLGQRSTPYVAIMAAAGMIAFAIAVPGDIRLLAGIYAFGATLAIAIAHMSVVRLRWTDPERERPFRVPFDVTVRGRGCRAGDRGCRADAAALDRGARLPGERALGGRRLDAVRPGRLRRLPAVRRGTSLTKRVSVPEEALRKEVHEAEYEDILVPVFGTELDDDIVSTAGRLADAAERPGEQAPKLKVIYVMDLPLTVPLDAPPPKERWRRRRPPYSAPGRWARSTRRSRSKGCWFRRAAWAPGSSDAARRRNVEVIVMGGEPPSRIRGGRSSGASAGRARRRWAR